MNKTSVKKLITVLYMLVFVASSFAVRGRPHIDSSQGYNILLSDQNSLLRGVSLSWDGGDPYGSRSKVMPTQAQLDSLANDYGLNTLHLYLEGDSAGNTDPIGYNAADCDILVQRCADAGLYLIITIGCNGENGTINLSWSQAFWNFYGPRYKGETHVIYEAHNEPASNSLWNWGAADWDNQVALYNTIRATAPDTFILLCSFMGFVGDNNINSVYDPRNRANYLAANGVSWANAGIAHHGYESKVGIETAISLLETGTNYPSLLCTEFWPGDTTGQEYNAMYESHFNGWMQFMWLGADDARLNEFKTKIDTAGTLWTPDVATCNWPARGAPDIPADGSSIGLFDRGAKAFVRANESGKLVADLATYTGSQGDRFVMEGTGNHRVSFKADNGLYVSTTSTNDALTADRAVAGLTEQFQWIELPNADVVLRSVGGGGHLIRSVAGGDILPDADNGRESETQYAFVDGSAPTGPPSPAGSSPYFGVPTAIPGRVEAENYDNGGEGMAYHDAGADNDGHSYRPFEGVDIESCDEGGYNVGWTQRDEWLNYTVNVAAAGEYVISARVARGTGGTGAFRIEFNGVDLTGSIAVQNTGGWQNWVSRISNVILGSGVQVMKVVIEEGDININHIGIELVSLLTPPVISIQLTGADYILRWPSYAVAYNLYSTTNLLPPVVWSSVTNTPVNQGDHLAVGMPLSGNSFFFLLSMP